MDLTTRYLGLTLKSPIVAGSSPLTGEPDNIRRLEDAGAGAVVMPSIFEEQIEQEQQLVESLATIGADSYSESLTYFPRHTFHGVTPGHYLDVLHRAAESVNIPIVASLNGSTARGWISYARQIEEAGAAALELNVYFIATDPEMSGRDVEGRYVDILKAVKKTIKIPVAVKIGPYFSSIHRIARQLDEAGADGLVLFNRFYEPDIDLVRLALVPSLELSSPVEIRLPLLWIGLLAGHLRASLAASTGVETADEVLKYLLAGADVVMTSSALLRHGVGYLKVLFDGVKAWLEARDLEALDTIRGCLSQYKINDPTLFERANYIRMLQNYRPNW
jgi:dihydroorotate dehydrogenase (fumarate)